jgi:hypothetical protein
MLECLVVTMARKMADSYWVRAFVLGKERMVNDITNLLGVNTNIALIGSRLDNLNKRIEILESD